MPRHPLVDSPSFEMDGYRLRNLRKLQGDTLATFAAKAEISFGFLSQVERGKRNVGPVVFNRICEALNITGDDRVTLMSPAARRRLDQATKAAA